MALWHSISHITFAAVILEFGQVYEAYLPEAPTICYQTSTLTKQFE